MLLISCMNLGVTEIQFIYLSAVLDNFEISGFPLILTLGYQKGVVVSDRKYDNTRPRLSAEVERAVKVEAGHECAIKGCSEHTYLEIHHINENREDNRIENLILLCDKHHKMSHASVIDRKSLKEYKKLLSIPDVGGLLDRFEKLESMLSMSGAIPARESISNSAINLILEEGVLLGNRLRGTHEGNDVAQQVFSLVRAHGDQMGLDSVELMVRRDDSYSRTGLSGLGILYDEFFEHAISLKLIDHFEAMELHDVAYYCALREHFPNEGDMSACMKSPDFKYGGFRVVDDNFNLISKYPNRGPSSVLDFLVYEGNSSEA